MVDVTPRTVRYYIGQGLLASPGSGPNARYTDAHLARLRLIRRLQRDHLPLAEIRRRLEDLPDDAVIAMADEVAQAAPSAPSDSAADYVRRVLGGPERRLAEEPALFAMPAPAPPPSVSPAPTTPPPPEPERSTWERHAVTADVEIHVRRPLDRHTSKQVDRLIRIARDLLGDES